MWEAFIRELQELESRMVSKQIMSQRCSEYSYLQLGPAFSSMTALRSIRLDAGEYGTVVETEGVIPDDLQRDFNRALMPITTLTNLESLAMVSDVALRRLPDKPCLYLPVLEP